MDRNLLGSNPANATVDYACWDVSGRSLGVPSSKLLGAG
ncbi:MAG: hypothetical protein M3Y71_02540 [Actinomycetota bacterium]|nr:hypothetical protein [Actinomycetota bacterium]